MNKRVRELMQEADRQCSETRGVYDEILAELIIRECAKQVNHIYKQGGGTYGETILNHFKIKVK